MQSKIGPVFSRYALPQHVACVLFEVPRLQPVGHESQFHLHNFSSVLTIGADFPTATLA